MLKDLEALLYTHLAGIKVWKNKVEIIEDEAPKDAEAEIYEVEQLGLPIDEENDHDI